MKPIRERTAFIALSPFNHSTIIHNFYGIRAILEKLLCKLKTLFCRPYHFTWMFDIGWQVF